MASIVGGAAATSAGSPREFQPSSTSAESAVSPGVEPGGAKRGVKIVPDTSPVSRRRAWDARAARTRAAVPGPRPQPARRTRIFERPAARYGIAVGFVVVAIAAAFPTEALIGRFLSFPFYAAVVASAWFGIGPGILSFILSALAVADFWTPVRYSLAIDSAELPSFAVFVVCALMSLAWSSQRRRAQHVLEATVEQRTADLRRSNAALQVEIAEREAAEEELRRSETLLAQGQQLSRTASWRLQLPGGDMQWSAQLFDILGLDREREALSYRVFVERLHPDDRSRFAQAVQRAIAESSDQHLMSNWSLLSGGKTLMTMPRTAVLRSFVMNHIIHHRAQLGVYLRLNNVPVPSIYGPSADEGQLGG